MIEVENELRGNGLIAGLVTAADVIVQPASELFQEQLNELVEKRRAEDFPPVSVKDEVRRLLRSGGFKPSGRNKPASEYLAQAAREGRFPLINNLVDINNYLSLLWGLPISLLDLGVVGASAVLRLGAPGESYVFNEAGQAIDVEGLVCFCRREGDNVQPLGNPVKDSMLGKIGAETTSVVAIIYGPSSIVSSELMTTYLELFAEMLSEHGGATVSESVIA